VSIFGKIANVGVAMKIEDSIQLGKHIRERREALEISQGDLAGIAGIDQANLSRLERGVASGTLETYLRLCKALGIDLIAVPRA
jgi:transcriptional regulator with XRE-family HTH domain